MAKGHKKKFFFSNNITPNNLYSGTYKGNRLEKVDFELENSPFLDFSTKILLLWRQGVHLLSMPPFLSCNFHRFDSRTGYWTLFLLTFMRLER